jgi:hypothetical protein
VFSLRYGLNSYILYATVMRPIIAEPMCSDG